MKRIVSNRVLMILIGILGLFVVYWVGEDGVISHRGSEITVDENPAMFFFFLSILFFISIFSILIGILLASVHRKSKLTSESLDNLSDLFNKEINNSEEIITKMEEEIRRNSKS